MTVEREVFMKAFRNPVKACLIVALLFSWCTGVKAAPPTAHFAVPSPVGAQTLPQLSTPVHQEEFGPNQRPRLFGSGHRAQRFWRRNAFL